MQIFGLENPPPLVESGEYLEKEGYKWVKHKRKAEYKYKYKDKYVLLNVFSNISHTWWQNTCEHFESIEWWDWDHIKHCKRQVDHDNKKS